MNFQQIISILLARKKIVLLILFVTVIMSMLINLIMPSRYEANTLLVVNQLAASSVAGTVMPVQHVFGHLTTQADIIASRNVAKKVVKKLKLAESEKWQENFAKTEINGRIEDWIADQLLQYIDVKPSGDSSLINISVITNNAQFSAIIANTFTEAYIETNVELRGQLAKQRSRWLESQIDNSSKHLQNSRSVLSNFQQKHNIIAVHGDLDLEKTRLTDLSENLIKHQGLTKQLLSRKEQLSLMVQQGEGRQIMQNIINNPLIQSLNTDLATAKEKFVSSAKDRVDNPLLYAQMEAEVFALENTLHSKVKDVMNSLSGEIVASQTKDEDLQAAIEQQREKVLQLKKQGDELAAFNRKVENAQHVYGKALETSTLIRIENEISQTNVAILNPAIPPHKSSSPKLLLNFIMAIFIGIILGICVALIMELTDRRVRSPIDIYKALEIPVLGIISEKSERKTNVFLSFYQHKKQSSG